jgi:uncharacterized protein YbjT (DUF2867 family)
MPRNDDKSSARNDVSATFSEAYQLFLNQRTVFVTGATGYLGRALVPRLLVRGHKVRALVRPGSEQKLQAHPGLTLVIGNPLDRITFELEITPADTFVQLVGVPHPSPAKAQQFRDIDGVSVRESVAAAKTVGIAHFIYVSVAQPAPIMKVYQEVRAEGERLIRESGMPATILRPWYILGPGHYWPGILVPIYIIAERIPSLRESALRLGLITLRQMVASLVSAIENPTNSVVLWDVPVLRKTRW